MYDVKGIEDFYYGDIDSEGKACGFGVIGYKNKYQKHTGTFFDNKIHGYCKIFLMFNYSLLKVNTGIPCMIQEKSMSTNMVRNMGKQHFTIRRE